MNYLKKIKKVNIICFIIIITLSISMIAFTKLNDNLYHNTIMKIEKIETTTKDTSSNQLGLIETYYQRKITGTITNGKDKGKKKTIEYEETFSSVVTEKYRVNDKVFIKNNTIEGLKRDTYLAFTFSIFLISIFLVGNFRGCLAIISVIFNTLIFYFGLDLYFKGVNLLLLCLIESLIFTTISLIIASGINKKTFTAIISVIISMFILLALTLTVIKTTNYSGISFNDMSFLTVPVEDVFKAEIMIGGLGAIMDIAITFSSAISELIEKNNKITKKALIESGRKIGKDVMSTMINVLFFTYLCSGLPVFTLAIRNGFTLHNYLMSNLSLEMTRFLVGSIGIIITIPVSLFVAIKIFKRGEIDE